MNETRLANLEEITTPDGRRIAPAVFWLAQVPTKAREAVAELLQDYSELQQTYMLVRSKYRTDADCALAMGLGLSTPASWRSRNPNFEVDADLVISKVSDFQLNRLKLQLERLGKIATDEAQKLLEMPWDDITDRMAGVKARLISDLWKGIGFIKGPSILIQNTPNIGGMNFEDFIAEVREAQRKGLLDGDGNVIELDPSDVREVR